MTMLLFFISFLFATIASIGSPGIFVYGVFVFLSVYAYTGLMDGNANAWVWESVKNMLGVGIIATWGDWFGASQYFTISTAMVAAYFFISTGGTAWFCLRVPATRRSMASV